MTASVSLSASWPVFLSDVPGGGSHRPGQGLSYVDSGRGVTPLLFAYVLEELCRAVRRWRLGGQCWSGIRMRGVGWRPAGISGGDGGQLMPMRGGWRNTWRSASCAAWIRWWPAADVAQDEQDDANDLVRGRGHHSRQVISLGSIYFLLTRRGDSHLDPSSHRASVPGPGLTSR